MVLPPGDSVEQTPEADGTPASREEFRKRLIEMLDDPAAARLLARRLLGPLRPIAGAACLEAADITAGTSGTNCGSGDFNFPGKLGIGVASPAHALDAAGNVRASQSLIAGSGQDVRWGDTSVRVMGVSGTSGSLQFHVASAERMRITSDGRVGIGLTNPSYPLTVNGSILARSGGYLNSLSPDGSTLMQFFATNGWAFLGTATNHLLTFGTNDQDVALFRHGAGGGLVVQSFNNTASGHAFAVRWPANQTDGADLFRVKTLSNIAEAAGEVTLKSHGDDQAPWSGSEVFQATAAKKTTDGNPATLATLPLADNRAYYITARVVARKSDGTDRAFFWRAVLAYRQRSTAPIQANTVLDLGTIRSNALSTCTVDANGNDIRVRVTGLGETTIYWLVTIEYQSVSTDALEPLID